MANPLNNLSFGPMGARNIPQEGSIKRSGVKIKKRRPGPTQSPHKPLGLPPGFSHGIR